MNEVNALPVIKLALHDNWGQLADVVKQHYDVTPGKPESMVIKGVMEKVYHSPFAKLFLLPGRIFGALVPYKGRNIATEVRNWTTAENDAAMFWHRTMEFPNRSPVIFASRMEHVTDNEIIEYVRFGMGIRMKMSVEDSALVFKSTGYVWKVGALRIPIPTWAILGDAVIVEKAIDDEKFHIDFGMVHPLFGRTFAYSGTFSIQESIQP